MSASVRNRAANPGTDYNDGKWHPWTGENCAERHPLMDRACPVHPESVVEVLFRGGCKGADEVSAFWFWFHDGSNNDIVAFRVVEEFREPRTFWGYLDRDTANWEFSEDELYARDKHAGICPVIEMQEVRR